VIPTLHGDCRINIPKGTQNSDVIRLKKKGCPMLNKEKFLGDQHNIVNVKIPKDVSKEEEKFLKEIGKIKERENYEESKA
jgi:molecular chaperone DnaJ